MILKFSNFVRMIKNFSELRPPYKFNKLDVNQLIKESNSDVFDASIFQQLKCSQSFEYPKLQENTSQLFRPVVSLPQLKKGKSFQIKMAKQKKLYDENPAEQFQIDLQLAEISARNILPTSSALKKWSQINGKFPGQREKFVSSVNKQSDIQKEADYWFNL